MAPPDFGRSVNPISTEGGRLCPSNNTGTPGFSDLATAVLFIDDVMHYFDDFLLHQFLGNIMISF
jgi:hypothetical protein